MGKGNTKIGYKEYQVLCAILRSQRDPYGTEIRRVLEKNTGRKFSIGAIHSVLDQLDRKGLVEIRFSEPVAERGGRRKKLFSVNGDGISAISLHRDETLSLAEGLVLPEGGLPA